MRHQLPSLLLLHLTNNECSENGIKIRVDNLHYDLTEEDLKVIILICSLLFEFERSLNELNQELFSRIGHVLSVNLLYDRQDRSKGIAFVQYARESDARLAIREFDGANAHGQPIRLTQMPSKQPQQPSRNPFDHVEGPSRSLFERVDSSNINRNVVNTRRNHRSASPDDDDSDYRNRRSNVTKPPPDHIDRYVPDRRNARSPMPRIGGGGGGGRDGGRRPGARRDNSVRKDAAGGGGGGVGRDGRRPKKTSDDLDAEMADYWGDKGNNAGMNGTGNDQVVNAGTGFGGQERDVEVEEDVDMIE